MAGEDDPPESLPDRETTASLLARIRGGEQDAREVLFARVLPVLQRWAHRRLPAWSRDAADTDDLVQVTLLRALVRMEDFEHRGEGAFLGYLRQILLNAVRDQLRRAGRRPVPVPLDETMMETLPAGLASEVPPEAVSRYESALATLGEESRQAVVLRLEFEYTYPEIARALAKPSPDAARMLVNRGIQHLIATMRAPAGPPA